MSFQLNKNIENDSMRIRLFHTFQIKESRKENDCHKKVTKRERYSHFVKKINFQHFLENLTI